MRVLWWQLGIHIEPENQREHDLLSVLTDSVRFEKPPEVTFRGGSGKLELRIQDGSEFAVTDHQIPMSDVVSDDLGNQEAVSTCVDEMK